ncbi:hypothetical protein HDU76_003523 [Blyttiomyces sp. JEL0837]|nr:hypothetical protein HDU76_003523 [Blyttiomyces sp. JEL0837]
MLTWGLTAALQAFTTNFAGLLACRFFLGLFEAGFFPGIVFYLSYWYRRKELALRIGIFLSASTLSGAFGGVAGYYLAQSSLGYISGWRAVLFWEGIPSIILAFMSWFLLPDHPETSAFLTSEEKEMVNERLMLDGIDTGLGHNFDWGEFWNACCDLKVWCYMFIYLGILTPVYGFAFFLPTIIKLLGYTSLQAQLYSSPPYCIAFVMVLLLALSSDRFHDRSIHIIGIGLIGAASFFVLAYYRGDNSNNVLYWTTAVALSGTNPMIPISLSWLANNVRGQTRAATSTALMVSFGNIGGIIGPQIYQPGDAGTLYKKAQVMMACSLIWTIIWTVILRFYLQHCNQSEILRRQRAGELGNTSTPATSNDSDATAVPSMNKDVTLLNVDEAGQGVVDGLSKDRVEEPLYVL